jgi:hypothetical protein
LTASAEYVLDLFVPTASATAALPNDPEPVADLAPALVPAADPAPAPAASPASAANPAPAAAGAPALSCAGRVLSLLRKLIDYGQELARTVQQQQAAAVTLFTVAVRFGTKDFALILARITRGLRLANALEARLVSRPIRPDAVAAPARQDAVPTVVQPPADGATRADRRAEPRPMLPEIPTAEEIAAALRHRPAAAVIADICRDLGIVPAHPLWNEVRLVLAGHGGNFGEFWKDIVARVCTSLTVPSAAEVEAWPEGWADGWPAPWSQPAAARGTGPP